jgi:hypothetical protein
MRIVAVSARLSILLSILSLSAWECARAQDPAWEASVLVSRTKASVRFDANGTSNGDRMGVAPTLAVSRAARFGAVRFEASIVKKGFERTAPTWHWTYLELAVLLELRPASDSGMIQGVGHVGLAPSFALQCTVSYAGVQGPYRGDCQDRDPLGLLAPASMFDLSWIAGLGARVGTGPTRLLFNVRMTKGMRSHEGTSKHLVLSAGAGLSIQLSRAAGKSSR